MNRSLELLEAFVRQWREPIRRQTPIDGSDAVEYLCEFYDDARKAIKADKALDTQRHAEQRSLDL